MWPNKCLSSIRAEMISWLTDDQLQQAQIFQITGQKNFNISFSAYLNFLTFCFRKSNLQQEEVHLTSSCHQVTALSCGPADCNLCCSELKQNQNQEPDQGKNWVYWTQATSWIRGRRIESSIYKNVYLTKHKGHTGEVLPINITTGTE